MVIRERRREPRFNVHHQVYFYRNQSKREARSLDIGLDGVKLETDAEVFPNEILELTMLIRESLVKVKGKVIYVESMPEGIFHFGVAFENLSQESRGSLMRYFSDIMTHGAERRGILRGRE
ncbi:MAG: hypothetical protein GTN81_08750 [Proteobacteria bacterium]|nr:hypothetical protein [Pseudomonadota bacterium]